MHEPHSCIPVLICTHHQTGIVRCQSIHPGLKPVYMELLEVYTIRILPYLPFALLHQSLSVLDILSQKFKIGQQRGTPGRVLSNLLVQKFDLSLKLRLTTLLTAHILSSNLKHRKDGYNDTYVYSFHHFLTASLRFLIFSSSPSILSSCF